MIFAPKYLKYLPYSVPGNNISGLNSNLSTAPTTEHDTIIKLYKI